MKKILIIPFLVGSLAGCTDMKLPIAVNTTNAGNTASIRVGTAGNAGPTNQAIQPGTDDRAMRNTLACKSKAGYLDPDAVRSTLDSNPAVAKRFRDQHSQSIYAMQAGYSISGIPVTHITVYGTTESDAGGFILAYTDKPVATVRKATGITNQKERPGLFTFLKNDKVDFAGGKRLTAFGCMTGGMEE
ncbi:hypothetical protein [Chromobacterium haemolyticum]|uniref:hypothetical protein n=1 Tax=Chromobacterium haemolyticum TaxID=394935 RepID=UPI002447EC24|nr:hypothetical protein [Chromobacterium haemolyticum]MDH0342081.1 hypothetical protein [Chromobacterium haemolyticum]